MRLFETLLLLTDVSLLCFFIFSNNNKQKKLLCISGISSLILILHFVIEGYRWQFILLYCVTIIFFPFSAYKYFKKTNDKKGLRFLSIFLSILFAISIISTIVLTTLFPVFFLPKPTGELKVGTQTFHFIDVNRNEEFAEGKNSKRELMVQVWYPAKQEKGRSTFFISNNKIRNALAKSYGVPEIVTDYLKYNPSHSYEGAEVSSSSGSYPLIILNHGLGSSRLYHTSYAENLASHGYIVAVIDHTYGTLATIFSDEKITYFNIKEEKFDKSVEYRNMVGQVWTKDIAFTIDQFEKINAGTIPSVLEGKIDVSNIGVFGHSFGGAASYDSMYDSRIKVGIDLDGSLYDLPNQESMTKPFVFIFSEQGFQIYNNVRKKYRYSDQELEAQGYTREQYEKEIQHAELEVEQIKQVVRNGGQALYIEGTKHNNFMDQQLISPLFQLIGLTGEIDGKRSTAIVNEYVLDFFNKHLKYTGGSLFKELNPKYPEVKFVSSLFLAESKKD